MNIKCALGGVALAVAGQAVAQGPNLAPGDSAGLLENDFSLLYAQHVSGDAFNDVYSFDVSSAGIATAVAFEVDASQFPDAGNLQFSFAYLALTDAAFNVIASDIDGSDGWQIAAAPLSAAGTYRVVVGGSVAGAIDQRLAESLSGAYIGSVATAVGAVPEPATYALFFAGLAVIGAVVRVRRPS